jgi:Bacteriophage tail sheath protein
VPAQLTYPGVYIEEVPSGVHTITGVATSITAFVGRAARGPVNEPIMLTSYADFERRFGGLSRLSSLGFAVRDFFQNGGSQAIVVRLYRASADPETATIDANGFALRAANPGSWGNALRARVETGGGAVSPDLADEWQAEFPGIATSDLFNLIVRDTATGATEEYRNVTVVDSPRRIDTILENQSRLVVVDGTPAYPTSSDDDPDPGEDIWADDSLSSPVNQDGSDGQELDEATFTGPGMETAKEGLFALEKADLFNLLCIPPYDDGDVDDTLVGDAAAYCERRRAMLVVDPRSDWDAVEDAVANVGAVGTSSRNAALFFPHIRRPNPLFPDQIENFAPSGAVAGIFARTDAQRGVWKAPAGQNATIVGAPELSVPLTDGEIGQLNPLGVNCLRVLPAAGRVVWGSRTLQGNDRLASEWKYIPVRRTALFLEESLYRGTHWVVFEPNAEPLWAQIRLNVGAFMNTLFRQGAFAGTTPREAYFVKCDAETTTPDDVNLGVVNIAVGFAPLKPAEFVVIRIQQIAGQTGGA